MALLRPLILAACSGILMPLALPNELFHWGCPALGLVALAPLYLAMATSSSWSRAFFASAVFGGLAHGISSYWLWFFHDFRLWTLGSTIVAYMLVYGVMGLYLRGVLLKGGLWRPLLFAMAWTVIEWGKSNGFLAYPWGLLAYSWNDVGPAIQIAESTGVYGLSFSLAWISAALGELLAPKPAPIPESPRHFGSLARMAFPQRNADSSPGVLGLGHLAVAAVMFLAVLGYGFVALDRPRIAERFLNGVIVQQNMDTWDTTQGELDSLSRSIGLAREAIAGSGARPDIVLFSETTLRRDWDDSRRFYERYPRGDPLIPFLAENDTYLFAGAFEILDRESNEATNSVILVGPDGGKLQTYAKMHPVPFAEAIPFWEYAWFRDFMRLKVGLSSGWVMGGERVIFSLPSRNAGTVSFAGPICFEDAFAYLCREFVLDGAEVLVNLTNDSWSKTRSAEIQHFVAARFRSVETRRTLVRSTNGGVSAVVLPDGSIGDMLPLFQATARSVRIPVYTAETTPYLVLGDWFPASLAFILAACACILFIAGQSKKEVAP